MSSCYRLSRASCTCCDNSAIIVAGSVERASSRFFMAHTCSIGERSEVLAGQGSCCKHEEHVESQQPYVDLRFPTEKAHYIPVEEMTVAQG